MTNHKWHVLSQENVLQKIGSNAKIGLTKREASARLRANGYNKLHEHPKRAAWQLFLAQFQDLMVIILLVAAGISAFIGEQADVWAILAIVIVNALLGFIQERRAEASLAALKQLTAPTSRVLRDGVLITVKAEELVVGDIVELESGDRVPADIRLLISYSLAVNESPLTGESLPVSKDATWQAGGSEPIGDRRNMLFMGTTIVRGRAKSVVVATGMDTQIGEIAGLLQEGEQGRTPLQLRLEQLGKALVIACLLVVGMVFAAGVIQGASVYIMFLTAVSLAVAAIPEGLPAVVTIALAIGVQRMIKRKAIVRRLPAVETLGCATIICSDKTGTLTRNEMTVVSLLDLKREVHISGAGYNCQGKFTQNTSAPIDPCADSVWRTALVAGALCNHAFLHRDKGKKDPVAIGDPTEAALVVMAAKGGIDVARLRADHPVLAELPFDSDRKRMSVVVNWHGRRSVVKGAPDVIIDRCTHILQNGRVELLGPLQKRQLRAKAAELAANALRLLALAYRQLPHGFISDPPQEELVEQNLIFIALTAMADPPRDDVKRAIRIAAGAGVRTVMVTGDHKQTAVAIGRQLGIGSNALALTGDDLDKLDEENFLKSLQRVSVFARVSPRHKLRIVRGLQHLGHIVAMTGDGVNDAPAVKEADIGVAMGISGTDVTKEASSMVLADDNYVTIVAAIEEGRGIYENIRKFIRYLLACNVGEVLTMFITAVAGLPMPLLPIQILWMNLVTDGLPAVALSVDPPDTNVMNRPPRQPKEGVFAHGLHLKILMRGSLIGFCTVALFVLALCMRPGELGWAQTMTFTTLVTSQLLYVFQCRSEYRSIFDIGLFSNPYLLFASGLSFLMQLAVIYSPAAANIFHTTPLGMADWLLIAIASGWSIVLEGILRLLRIKWRRHIAVLRIATDS